MTNPFAPEHDAKWACYHAVQLELILNGRRVGGDVGQNVFLAHAALGRILARTNNDRIEKYMCGVPERAGHEPERPVVPLALHQGAEGGEV